MSRIDDPNHYQHTTVPTSPPPGTPAPPRRYRPGDRVTVVPADTDPLLLHMQRQVTVVSKHAPDSYLVELGAVSPDQRIQGPIPAARLLPGWVEQDGSTRLDLQGHRSVPEQERRYLATRKGREGGSWSA